MSEREKEDIPSQEIQELLGTPPSWFVRWGTALIAASMLTLLGVGLLLRYPEVVRVPVSVTTEMPPVSVVVRREGFISEIFAGENQVVAEGEAVALQSDQLEYQDILTLQSKLEQFQPFNIATFGSFNPEDSYQVGTVQGALENFRKALRDYHTQSSARTEGMDIRQMQNRISNLLAAISRDDNRKSDAEIQVRLAKKSYETRQMEYTRGQISLEQLEAERTKKADSELKLKNIESEIDNKKIEISSLRDQIKTIQTGQRAGTSSQLTQISTAFKSLKSAIDTWKQENVLVAPIGGTVSFFNGELSKNQYFRQGEALLAIVPKNENVMVGRISLPLKESGKVSEGKAVLISFHSYSPFEYGKVEGVVSYKAKVPKDNAVALEVTLPNGLHTNKGKSLKFEQQMEGSAEIITSKRRFITKIFGGE
jgi:multidrug efflux pump subunit AcrA (membrane-fusion protein)